MKMNKVSAEKVYFWNILGNLAFSGSSVLFTLIVTRLTSPADADAFSLAYGVAAILVVVAMFQVRTYQGTDVTFRHSFTSYALARSLTICLMLLVLFPYLFISGIDISNDAKLQIILLYVLFRACEAISDLFQGLFQQRERLDIAGKSMTYRYSISTVMLFLSLVLTKSLVCSLLLLVIFNLIFVFCYDYQQSKQFEAVSIRKKDFKELLTDSITILKNCIPLFISGFLLAYIFNEPRVAIDVEMKAGHLIEGTQRDYNILFMPVFFMSLFILILRPLTTALAILWNKKEFQKFRKTVTKLVGIMVVAGLFLTVVAYWIGTPILSLIFGLDLNFYQSTLAVLVFSGILYSIGIVFGDILTIFRKQQYLLPVYLLMFITSKLTNFTFVKQFGLFGAASSFFIVMLVYVIGSLGVYFIARKIERKENVI